MVRCTHHLPIGFVKPALLTSSVVELREGTLETSEGVFKYRDVGPILLTDEIMEKCGAKKITEDEVVIFKNETEEQGMHFLIENTKYYYIDSQRNKLSTMIEYVHHLQNLFFFMMGKELDVKL